MSGQERISALDEKGWSPAAGARLRAAAKRARIQQTSLAEEAGVARSSLNAIFNGSQVPRPATLEAICRAIGVDPNEILSFEASRNSGGEGQAIGASDRSKAADDVVQIGEIDLRFGLGGAFMDEEIVESQIVTRSFPRSWLRQITKSKPEDLYWAKGQGNSMEPLIGDGDIILIDRSQVSLTFGDLVWAVAYGQTGMVKRLRPMADGSVKILSDNANVPPEIAYDGELHIFGRVVAVVSSL